MADAAHAKTPKSGQQTSPEADPTRIKKPKRAKAPRDAPDDRGSKDSKGTPEVDKKRAADAEVGTPPRDTPTSPRTPKDGQPEARPGLVSPPPRSISHPLFLSHSHTRIHTPSGR